MSFLLRSQHACLGGNLESAGTQVWNVTVGVILNPFNHRCDLDTIDAWDDLAYGSPIILLTVISRISSGLEDVMWFWIA